MMDSTPPQPHKRFSSSQIYAAAFEAKAISDVRDRIASLNPSDPNFKGQISAELVKLSGTMLESGERRITAIHRAVLFAYREAGEPTTIQGVLEHLPSGYSLSQIRIEKYLLDLGIEVS